AAYGRVRLTIRLERCVCSTHCFKELNIDPLLEHERLQASHDKREPKLVKSEKAAVLVFKASVYNLLGNGMRDLVAAMNDRTAEVVKLPQLPIEIGLLWLIQRQKHRQTTDEARNTLPNLCLNESLER